MLVSGKAAAAGSLMMLFKAGIYLLAGHGVVCVRMGTKKRCALRTHLYKQLFLKIGNSLN